MSTTRPPFSYASRCETCATCKRTFRPNDPVWRCRVGVGRGFFGGWRTAIDPVCAQCASDDLDLREYSTGPCDNCGRTVHDAAWRFPRRYRYCCQRCELTHQSARLAAAARQRRADARGPSRPCLECGEHFALRRADSQYCSAPCKQKAYRKRALRLQNDEPRVSFVSGNADIALAAREPERAVGAMIECHHSRLDLAKQADVILKRARCDTVTGAKKDRNYRRNKRAERKRFARRWREKRKKLGKFGPASPVRVIEPEEIGQKD
jgi:hypothetical protein